MVKHQQQPDSIEMHEIVSRLIVRESSVKLILLPCKGYMFRNGATICAMGSFNKNRYIYVATAMEKPSAYEKLGLREKIGYGMGTLVQE